MRFVAWFVAVAVALPVAASAAGPVDLELVLSVDSSGSIDEMEFELQRVGYAEALVHPEVLKAIRSGPHKAIALTMIEWSGPGIEEQVVPWTRVSTPEEARAVADRIMAAPRTIFGGGTGIGGAIASALTQLENKDFQASHRIIDVSGDGFNNKGPDPEGPRDMAVARGVVINGLTVGDPDGWLTEYYKRSVIGGRGAFVLSAKDFKDFQRAVVRKLIREIYVSQADAPVTASGTFEPDSAVPR